MQLKRITRRQVYSKFRGRWDVLSLLITKAIGWKCSWLYHEPRTLAAPLIRRYDRHAMPIWQYAALVSTCWIHFSNLIWLTSSFESPKIDQYRKSLDVNNSYYWIIARVLIEGSTGRYYERDCDGWVDGKKTAGEDDTWYTGYGELFWESKLFARFSNSVTYCELSTVPFIASKRAVVVLMSKDAETILAGYRE